VNTKFNQNITYRFRVTGGTTPVDTPVDITDIYLTDTDRESSLVVTVGGVNESKIVMDDLTPYYLIVINKNMILHHQYGSSTTNRLKLNGIIEFQIPVIIDQNVGQFYSIFDISNNSGTYRTFNDVSQNILSSNYTVYQYDTLSNVEYVRDISKNGYSYHHHMIDLSGRLHLITKSSTNYKYDIHHKNNSPIPVSNVFMNTNNLLENIDLNDLKSFLIYPNFQVVIGFNQTDPNTTKFHLGINELLTSEYITGTTTYKEIIYVQYMAINKYYIFVMHNGNNKVDLLIRDPSGNIENPFTLRTITYVDHYVRDNVFYLLGRETISATTKTILFVFMKGELLFESDIGDGNTTFGLGDLYYKDSPTSPTVLRLIEMSHDFIGVYRSDWNLVQISGTIPSYFDSTFKQKNVYYDNITNEIVKDRSKDWIGLKDANSGFYIKY
jgi:hypothetical protein